MKTITQKIKCFCFAFRIDNQSETKLLHSNNVPIIILVSGVTDFPNSKLRSMIK